MPKSKRKNTSSKSKTALMIRVPAGQKEAFEKAIRRGGFAHTSEAIRDYMRKTIEQDKQAERVCQEKKLRDAV
jgi:Arc/MetJ-type ribon-helix-helix transcriptional regulator